jgi:hypothetical protein
MRRAIAAAVTGGLMLGGAVAAPSSAAVGTAPVKPAVTPAKTPAKASSKPPTKPASTTAKTTVKTVVYGGYEFQVPTGWPVYRLDEHPQTCVRYDVHAVYLGTPGPDMKCPAGLIGRTQTVSFIPGKRTAAAKGAVQPQADGGTELQRLSAVHGAITQNAEQHELSVGLGAAPGATVVGTYAQSPSVVKQVLSTLRVAPADAEQTAQSGPAPSAARAPAASTSWPGLTAQWPIEIVQSPKPTPAAGPPAQPATTHPVGGFDTCTAPSLATMKAWRSDYAAVGVYIGGANAACASGNLSASWIKSVAAKGWGVLPTYVGPQAPCWGGTGDLIKASTAAAQGEAAAADAVKEAKSFGLGVGAPIYYDMEAYNGGTSCSNAVLEFLGSWDRKVAAAGYVTGVYSSQDSGISDMQLAGSDRQLGFTPPDAVWIALWDNNPTLSDGNLEWPVTDRAKQYSGGINATVGGITLNIDKDIVGGPMAH